jgi:hypothetical protein
MNVKAKTLIPNREWLIRNATGKVASLSKDSYGYALLFRGNSIPLSSLSEIDNTIGSISFEDSLLTTAAESFSIYGYSCDSTPYDPVYDVKRKLPIYLKIPNSKSQHCAGYYIIKFRKGWIKSFCPKLLSLGRYQYRGPFKTEEEMIAEYQRIKNETT